MPSGLDGRAFANEFHPQDVGVTFSHRTPDGRDIFAVREQIGERIHALTR